MTLAFHVGDGVRSGSPHLPSSAAVGAQGSLARLRLADRQRSPAHIHTSDEFLYVLGGEVALFLIDGDGRRRRWGARTGDFVRIPAMSVHWLSQSGAAETELISLCCPPGQVGEEPAAVDLLADWEPSRKGGRGPASIPVDPRAYGEDGFEPEGATGPDSLFKHGSQVLPNRVDNPDGTFLETRMVFGPVGSVMEGTRPSGYHSRPHVHACEQINLVLSGTLWGYVIGPDGDGHAFELAPGDYWRVPPMAVHWIWNRSADACRMIELHTPGLHQDPKLKPTAVPLFASYETVPPRTVTVCNTYVDVTGYSIEAIEAQRSETG